MLMFKPHGPCELPLIESVEGKVINVGRFWGKYRIRNRIGCYLFAMCATKKEKDIVVSQYSTLKGKTTYKYIPYFIGSASTSFEEECFKKEHLNKYHKIISESSKKLTPVMFFVSHPEEGSKTVLKDIERLKEFMVQSGKVFNVGLCDLDGDFPCWGIQGMIREKKSGTSQAGNGLKSVLGFNLGREKKVFCRH